MEMVQTEIFSGRKRHQDRKEQFGLKEVDMEWWPAFTVRPGHLCIHLTSEEFNRAP